MTKVTSDANSATHKWQFAPHFRRNAFGWRSETPIRHIKEALAEIKLVLKKDPVLAAVGAIVLLEKLSPALEHVDSSSGALGSAVNRAIDTLVPIISKARVTAVVRQAWLQKLWQALEEDHMPYLEALGEHWGELCADANLASQWADEFLPTVKRARSPDTTGQSYFKGTTACLSALLAAERHQELLDLIATAHHPMWHDRCWGVKALLAMGKMDEALRYAQAPRELNDPPWQIAQTCEEILLLSGRADEAYQRYALEANQSTTNLATFRAICKKYPNKRATDVLRDLVDSTPGFEGKWFAAAKDAEAYDVAVALIQQSPADPRTLTRAAKDFCSTQPDFAMACGLAALHWISKGYGYEITAAEVHDAYAALLAAASHAGVNKRQVIERVRSAINDSPAQKFVAAAVGMV